MATELDDEQRRIDHAYACLDAMRRRAQELLAMARHDADTSDKPDLLAVERAMLERLTSLVDAKAP